MCSPHHSIYFFFFSHTATTEIYTLSLHDALPIHFLILEPGPNELEDFLLTVGQGLGALASRWRTEVSGFHLDASAPDRKSTRLNSSHLGISYAVFCLKKKKTNV